MFNEMDVMSVRQSETVHTQLQPKDANFETD